MWVTTPRSVRAYSRRTALYSPRSPDLNSFVTSSYALPARGAVTSTNTAEERASAKRGANGVTAEVRGPSRDLGLVHLPEGGGLSRRGKPRREALPCDQALGRGSVGRRAPRLFVLGGRTGCRNRLKPGPDAGRQGIPHLR